MKVLASCFALSLSLHEEGPGLVLKQSRCCVHKARYTTFVQHTDTTSSIHCAVQISLGAFVFAVGGKEQLFGEYDCGFLRGTSS